MVNLKLVEEIECSKYVDDLISGGETTKQALEIKITATAIFGRRLSSCTSGILTIAS